MDLYTVLKQMFGFPNTSPSKDFNFKDYNESYQSEIFQPEDRHEESVWKEFSEMPMEFHNMIEKQMEHILQSFGLDSGFSNFMNLHPEHGPIEAPNDPSLREQFLKPGFDHPLTKKTDADLDGQINIDELETVLDSKEKVMPVNPYQRHNIFFGQSKSIRTVIKPDGSVETTQTVRDNDGNQETIISHKGMDGEYRIISRINKHGEETTEKKILSHSEIPSNDLVNKPQSWIDYFFKH